ncbi:MAG: biopolymer transporter ExbD [Planctomycetota bacterium]
MPISVTCLQCGAINKVNESLAGRRVRCPECDTVNHVPELDFGSGPPPLPGADDEVSVEAVEVEAVEVAAVEAEAIPVEVEAHTEPVSSGDLERSEDLIQDDDDDDDFADEFKRKKREEEELDMTPMVDVTFLLLIFFMVTAAFSLQKSIEMPRQQSDAPSTNSVDDPPEELDQIEVQVDEFGSFLVLAADWQDETPGKQNLITALKRARADMNAKLVIKVHELCKLQYLVDAMDAGTIAGFAETQVTQVEEF